MDFLSFVSFKSVFFTARITCTKFRISKIPFTSPLSSTTGAEKGENVILVGDENLMRFYVVRVSMKR